MRIKKNKAIMLTAGAAVLATAALAASTAAAAPGPQPRVVVRPGMVRLAVRATPATTAQCEQLYGIACYQPDQLRDAYNLPALYRKNVTGKGVTIVIVDPFGSPTIRHDLATFDGQFGYPAPPSFDIIAPAGKIPAYDPANRDMVGAAGETSLDVEYAHALAPGANILLVETPVAETTGTTGFPEIVTAEKYVIDHGLGDVISQSFGTVEESFTNVRQLEPLRAAYRDAYAHNVTVLAATGDSGATAADSQGVFDPHPVSEWPASDPLVTAVGGTRLIPGGDRFTSVAWNDTDNTAVNQYFAGVTGPNPIATGGGTSEFFARPSYQDSVKSIVGDRRGVPDIAMSAACDGAVEAYGSFGGVPAGWQLACGTSEATPEFAAIVALADQVAGHRLGLINPRLYALAAEHAPGIVDVTSGDNTVSFPDGTGNLTTVQGYPAGKGYDLVTGVGTIDAPLFVQELA